MIRFNRAHFIWIILKNSKVSLVSNAREPISRDGSISQRNVIKSKSIKIARKSNKQREKQ